MMGRQAVDDHIHLVNLSNQHVIDVDHGKTANNTELLVYPKHSPAAANQQWRLEPVGTNRFYIASALNPNMVIEIPSKAGATATKLVLYEKNQGLNQQWEWFNDTIHSALDKDLVLASHGGDHGTLVTEKRNGKPNQSWQKEKI